MPGTRALEQGAQGTGARAALGASRGLATGDGGREDFLWVPHYKTLLVFPLQENVVTLENLEYTLYCQWCYRK